MAKLLNDIRNIRESIVENREKFHQDFYYEDEYVIVSRKNAEVTYKDKGEYEDAKRRIDFASTLAALVP